MTLDEALQSEPVFEFRYELHVIIGTPEDCGVVTGLYSAKPTRMQVAGNELARWSMT